MSTRKWAEKERGVLCRKRSVIKWDYKTEACDYNRHWGKIVMEWKEKKKQLLPKVKWECFLFEEN